MSRINKTFVMLAAVLLLSPAMAAAQGFVSPWVGPSWGEQPVEADTAFGVGVGGMSGGVLGGELDVGYSPDFFHEPVDNHALTVMANLLVGAPIGGTQDVSLRPYLTGGLGLIRTSIDLAAADATTNDLGMNVGGGLMGFFSEHLGLRGDVRYFRNVTSDLQDLDFWRGTVGVVIR